MNTNVMIADLDSLAQAKTWQAYTKPTHSIAFQTLEKTLNNTPELASHYASIVRTAFLYSPKICLSAPQLFDGIFFLALGPERANGILGTSYKDAPPFTLSNKAKTPIEALLNTFFDCVWENEELVSCNLKRFLFSSCGLNITEELAKSQSDDFNNAFLTAMQTIIAKTSGERRLSIEFAQQIPCPSGINNNTWKQLWMHWTTWINAFTEGIITYQTVGSTSDSNAFSQEFESVLNEISNVYATLERSSGIQIPRKQAEAFSNAVRSLENLKKRIDFLKSVDSIYASYLSATGATTANESKVGPAKTRADEIKHQATARPLFSKAALEEAYEYAYQAGIAASNESSLIAVSLETKVITPILEKLPQSHCMFLSGKITDELAKMPYVSFANLLYRHRSLISAWRDSSSQSDIKKRNSLKNEVEYAIFKETKEERHSSKAKDRWVALACSLVVTVIAILLELFSITDEIPIILAFVLLFALEFGPELIDAIRWQVEFKRINGTVIHLRTR